MKNWHRQQQTNWLETPGQTGNHNPAQQNQTHYGGVHFTMPFLVWRQQQSGSLKRRAATITQALQKINLRRPHRNNRSRRLSTSKRAHTANKSNKPFLDLTSAKAAANVSQRMWAMKTQASHSSWPIAASRPTKMFLCSQFVTSTNTSYQRGIW